LEEFGKLLPVMADIIKHFDNAKLSNELLSTIKLRLETQTKKIVDSTSNFKNHEIVGSYYSI